MRKKCARKSMPAAAVYLREAPGRRTLYNSLVALFRYADQGKKWRQRIYRTVSLREAQRLEAAGEAEKVIRMIDNKFYVVGYQALKPLRASDCSPATLTLHTMQCVSGEVDHPSEVRKFLVWALIGDTKAVAVRPRISDAERVIAERLLGPSRRSHVRALQGMA